jgi:hypothetical protein
MMPKVVWMKEVSKILVCEVDFVHHHTSWTRREPMKVPSRRRQCRKARYSDIDRHEREKVIHVLKVSK